MSKVFVTYIHQISADLQSKKIKVAKTMEKLNLVKSSAICVSCIPQSNRQSSQSSPPLALLNLTSPHPDTSLTYIHRAGQDRAVALKPDQLAVGGLTKTVPAFARQGFPHIASHPECSLVILTLQTVSLSPHWNLV